MGLTAEEQEKFRQSVRKLMFTTPYISNLGIEPEKWDADGVVLRMTFDEKLSNDGRVYHGGAIASLMDTAGAAAVWAGHDFDKGMKASTVSMSINYLGAAYSSDVIAEARCVRRGKELAFSEIEIHDPDGKPVASGILVYRIVP